MIVIFSQFHRLVLLPIPREQDIYGRSRYVPYLVLIVVKTSASKNNTFFVSLFLYFWFFLFSIFLPTLV